MHDNLARDPMALPELTSQRGGTVELRLRPLRGGLRPVPPQAAEQHDAAPDYDAAPDATMPALARTVTLHGGKRERPLTWQTDRLRMRPTEPDRGGTAVAAYNPRCARWHGWCRASG
jgi:hypothetical protein